MAQSQQRICRSRGCVVSGRLCMRGLAVPRSDVFLKVVDILWDEAAEELQRKPDAEARDPDSA